jgi:hypothetical protein
MSRARDRAATARGNRRVLRGSATDAPQPLRRPTGTILVGEGKEPPTTSRRTTAPSGGSTDCSLLTVKTLLSDVASLTEEDTTVSTGCAIGQRAELLPQILDASSANAPSPARDGAKTWMSSELHAEPPTPVKPATHDHSTFGNQISDHVD